MAGVTIKHNKLGTIAASLQPKARMAVEKAAFDVEARAKELAPVDTGALVNSIQAEMTGELSAQVGVGVEYGAYQEYGTSRSPAHPYMTPAADAVRPGFEAAVKQLVEP